MKPSTPTPETHNAQTNPKTSKDNDHDITSQWKQMQGKVRQQWNKLTDNDLERIKGHRDELIGVLQERYGKARNEIEKEVNDFMNRHKN